MRRRAVMAAMVGGCLLAAACAGADAAGDTTGPLSTDLRPTAGADEAAPEPAGDVSDGTGTTPPDDTDSPTTSAVAPPGSADLPSSVPADLSSSVPSSVLESVPSSVPSDGDGPIDEEPGIDVGSEDADPLADAEGDEPSFEIGPVVAIDVDLASFPVDDAGQGGGATSGPGAPSDDGDPGQGGTGVLTGWAAADVYLESVLIRPGNTAASVAVMIGGDVVHTAAFGVRDPATGDPSGPEDRFRIASISKPITAITAMSLVRDGVVTLDEPIGQIVAEHVGVGQIPDSVRQLTLRRLLNHTSGFGKYQNTFFGAGATSCADAAAQAVVRGVGGGGYVYSNMNYCMAGLLIEALTGLAYEDAVYRSLLTPLGISGMRLAPTFDPGPDETQHTSTAGRNYMETLGGAGSWIATPTDLVTIFDALDLSTPGYKPLSLDTVLSMVAPTNGQYGQNGYGLGVISYGGGRFGHTGTIEATHAMVLNRGDGVTWAITVAGEWPGESTDLERIMNGAFEAGGFTT